MRFTNETLKRTLRTFLQAFIPSIAAGLTEIISEDGSFTKGALIAIVIPSIAAGIAAAMNLEKQGGEENDI